MATSKQVKEAEMLRISSIGDFKKRMGGMMELPSGAVVRVKNPGGLQVFLQSGQIPNALMPIVQRSLKGGQGVDAEEVIKPDGSIDPEMVDAMEVMLNNVVLKTVIEPEVHPIPDDEADRDEELLYVDEFPMEDKQFLMQWVSGGTRDLETFRAGLESNLGTIQSLTKS